MAPRALPPKPSTSLATRKEPPLLAAARAAMARAGRGGIEHARRAGGAAKRFARSAGRKALHGARAVAPRALDTVADVAIEEVGSLSGHLGAHAADVRFGHAAGWIKAGVELLTMLGLKLLTPKSVKTRRLARASFRGTLHHKLGVGLHERFPLQNNATATSGAEGEEGGGDDGQGQSSGY